MLNWLLLKNYCALTRY